VVAGAQLTERTAPQTCPLCNAPNNCAVAAGASDASVCWCYRTIIPAAARIAAGEGNACICSACATVDPYSRDPVHREEEK
jgi:hypothetical protein